MIWMKAEGEMCRRGLNLMTSPNFKALFMWGTYNYRVSFGFGFNWKKRKLHLVRNFWTRAADVNMELMMRNLYTREYLDDALAKERAKMGK